MRTKIVTLLLAIFLIGNSIQAQVNGYAQVTAINNANTILTVSNVNQTYGTFTIGQRVIVYHTQGNVVSKLGNNSNFGQIRIG